jgi:hypothetical protein
MKDLQLARTRPDAASGAGDSGAIAGTGGDRGLGAVEAWPRGVAGLTSWELGSGGTIGAPEGGVFSDPVEEVSGVAGDVAGMPDPAVSRDGVGSGDSAGADPL